MVTAHHSDTDAPSRRPWWKRACEPLVDVLEDALDPVLDVIEDHIIDPIDRVVTPRITRHQALTAHRRVSEARRYAETRAVTCWPSDYRDRARLLTAWAGLEATAARTRAGVHAQHADSDECCAPLIRLYENRAEVLRALAVVEEQSARQLPGRSPQFGAVPSTIRRLAEEQLTELVTTRYTRGERAQAASALAARLERKFGAAVATITRVYPPCPPIRKGT